MNFEKISPNIPEGENEPELPAVEKALAEKVETEPKPEITKEAERVEEVPAPQEKSAEKIENSVEKMKPESDKPEINIPLGDFAGSETDGKRIKIDDKERQYLQEIIPTLKDSPEAKTFSRAFSGFKTATEYGGEANTMSTVTKIIELPDGKKVFTVYNYPSSWVHRSIDRVARKLSGNPLRKIESDKWKDTFESRSGIPTIENSDPNVVIMPYIPNVNAYDLFTLNHKIEDFGPHEWAKKVGLGEKLGIAKKIIGALEEKHTVGTSWGEIILNNVIIQPDGTPVIVDPETLYDKKIPLDEQKARDLQEIIISVCAGLNVGEGVNDFEPVINELMGSYKDQAVLEKLKVLAGKKPTLLQKIVQPIYNKNWRRIDQKNFNSVRKAISNTE